MEQYFEIHHNPTYGVPYYYNPYTCQSLWELPEDSSDQRKVVDMRSEEEKEAYKDLVAKQKAKNSDEEERDPELGEELKQEGAATGEEEEFERAKALFNA